MARYITKITFPASHGADGWEWTDYGEYWDYAPYVNVPGTYRVTLWKCVLEGGLQVPTTEMGHIDFTLSTPADYSWATKVLTCGTDLPLDDDAATYALVFSSLTTLANLLNIGAHDSFYEFPLTIPEGWGYEFYTTADGAWRNDVLQPFRIAVEQDDVELDDFLESGEPSGIYSTLKLAFPLSEPPVGLSEEQHLIYFPVAASYAVTPVAPVNEATGEKIIANGLSWDSVDVGVVFDVLFREFGTTAFTVLAEDITDLLFAFPYNLTYNQIYFWIINEYTVDPGTGVRTLVSTTGEQYFTTEALIEYPTPSRRTVPDGLEPPGTMSVITGDNCLAGIRRIVVACNDEIWYEAIE